MSADVAAGSEYRRPPVSVVVPFLGGLAEARELLAGLAALRLRRGDELIVVDNNQAPVVPNGAGAEAIRVVHAGAERSAYHARNRGAQEAANQWLLFMDADCLPEPTLIDDYFPGDPGPAVGALAGRVAGVEGASTAERWATSRRVISQEAMAGLPRGPAAVTANLLVRRAAWESIGGFLEGVRSGGDLDLCWRLQDAGWALEWRPATVRHRHRRTVRAIIRQMRRYGAGNAWQNRRRPGASPPPRPFSGVPRMLGSSVYRTVRGQFEQASMSAIDGVALAANALGHLEGNAGPKRRALPATAAPPHSLAVFVDRFPVISESFIAGEARALSALGWRVRIEAAARPERPLLGGAREWRVDYLEDEGPAQRAAALAWLIARHPLRCAADPIRRRRWPAAERMPLRGLAPLTRRLARFGDDHVHAHFAGPGATHALRAGRLAGVGVSIAVHGYDVYAAPSGLPEKLDAAAFVAAPCEYVRVDLERMLGFRSRQKLRSIVMGVDGERFRRRAAGPGGRTVAAVGRYVEKKGFGHLLAAAAILHHRGEPIELVIAGDGPLRGALEEKVKRLGLAGSVELPRADSFEQVRDLLERADLFAMPSVIAADGDRDSMPVAVKEALAMEVPVVASDEVGLPELVAPEWGRLVAPADPEALAEGLAELLSLPVGRRAEMGRAGRAFVLEHCNPRREAEHLGELITASASGSEAPPARR